jgi:3-oxoacyl-[acyl-carrier protein] reductase
MKNYLFIGGTYGIGRKLIEMLPHDCNIFVAARSASDLPEHVKFISFDADSDDFPVDELPESLDGFVYFPGSISLKPFRSMPVTQFHQDMQINFFSMVKVLQTVLPRLIAADQASVVLFSSVAAQRGMPFHTSIAAAKAAVEGFAKSLAAEYAPKIRVNVIAPSLTDTPLASRFLNNDVKKERAAERHPLKRTGEPQEIAKMAAFLLQQDSSWTTAQVFAVDGGLSTISL